MRLRHIISTLTIATLPMGAMAQGLSSGLNPADMDTSVRPGDSFYQYACGGWIKSHPLPAAYSRYGSFDKLAEDNNIRINTLLTELLQGKGYEKGTIEQKLSDFYKLAMDSTRRNKEGVAPIKPILKEMDKARISILGKAKDFFCSVFSPFIVDYLEVPGFNYFCFHCRQRKNTEKEY